mgnify:CR=1 FL=1
MGQAGAIYSIGYGQRDGDLIRALLLRHGVQILVDVRSAPYSRHRPEFSKKPLRRAVEAAGMRYWFRGAHLGGMPRDPSVYVGGKLDPTRYRARPAFRRDLDRLACAAHLGAVLCLLCAEADPLRCHRFSLLGEELRRKGLEVQHIGADGRVKTQSELHGIATGGQLSLFG